MGRLIRETLKSSRWIHILFLAVISVLVIRCSDQPDKFFSLITVNEDLSIDLEEPLSDASRIDNTSHYEVLRDSLNRITEIKKVSGEHGRSIDFLLGIPSMTIEYGADYEKRAYFDQQGRPTRYGGFYSIRIKRNNGSSTVTWFGYNQCGKLIEDGSGVCQYLRTLNEDNRTTEELRFDRFGNPVTDNDGIFKLQFNYDENGKLVERSCFDSTGSLSNNKSGFATIKYKYDDQGNETEKSYYDSWGMPIEGSWCGSITRTSYDKHSNRIETSYYDKNGKLINCSETAIQKWAWNGSNDLTGVWRFDSDSNLVEATLYTRDAHGNNIETRYLGSDSQLVVDDWSDAAIIKYEYDGFDNVTKTSHYGIDGQPVIIDAGYFSMTSKYDENGRLLEKAYWNTDTTPVEDSTGVARYQYVYWSDSLDYEKRMFYGKNDQLKADSYFKVAIMQFAYDSVGNLVEDRYFGPDEQPTIREDRGAAIVRFKYDGKRQLVEQSYYDINDRLVNRIDLGYAILKQKYNDCGFLVEMDYFDEDRQLVGDSLGNAIYKYAYDDYGRVIRQEGYDIHSQLHEDSAGFAIYEYEWDENGNRTKYATYGADGKLKGNDLGIAVFENSFGEDERVRTVSWRNSNDQRLSFGRVNSMTFTYDSLDNVIRLENRNKSGALTTDSIFVAVYEFEYDSAGNQIAVLHKDVNNRLVNCKNGYAINRMTYNSNGNVLTSEYLNTSKKLVEHKQYLCAMYEYVYNDSGDHIKTIGYDKNRIVVGEWDQ